jgi:hypothetical protein
MDIAVLMVIRGQVTDAATQTVTTLMVGMPLIIQVQLGLILSLVTEDLAVTVGPPTPIVLLATVPGLILTIGTTHAVSGYCSTQTITGTKNKSASTNATTQ